MHGDFNSWFVVMAVAIGSGIWYLGLFFGNNPHTKRSYRNLGFSGVFLFLALSSIWKIYLRPMTGGQVLGVSCALILAAGAVYALWSVFHLSQLTPKGVTIGIVELFIAVHMQARVQQKQQTRLCLAGAGIILSAGILVCVR